MRRARFLPAFLLAGLFALLTIPILVLSPQDRPQAVDERLFHLPVIEQFSRELPEPNLRDYLAANSPGYHLAMAVAHRLTTGNIWIMRGLTAVIGCGVVLAAWRRNAGFAGGWFGALATLPLCCCGFVISSAAWLSSDNTALLAATLAVSLSIARAATPLRLTCNGLLSAAAVAVRQTSLWVMVPMVGGALMGTPPGTWLPEELQSGVDQPRRWSRLWWALLACVPGLAILLWLYLLWGGMVPERFRQYHAVGLNGAAMTFTLTALGAWGVWLIPGACAGTSVGDLLRRRRGLVLVATIIGLLAAIVPETSYLISADEFSPVHLIDGSAPAEHHADGKGGEIGHYGGVIWETVKRAPVLAGRSVVLGAGAVIGAWLLVLLWDRAARAGRGRAATLLLLAIAAFIVVQLPNTQTFERYFDPFVLVALGWLASMGVVNGDRRHGVRTAAGLAIMTICQVGYTAATVYRDELRSLLG